MTKPHMVLTLFMSAWLLLSSGCDNQSTDPDPDPSPEVVELESTESVLLSNGAVKVFMDSAATLSQGQINVATAASPKWKIRINLGGPIVAVDGLASLVSSPRLVLPLPRWRLHQEGGLFAVDGSVDGKISHQWPSSLGAPTHEAGGIQTLGSTMAWGLYQFGALDAESDSGLFLGISTFLSENEVAKNIIFQRYDMINNSDQLVENIYFGIALDPDVYPPSGCSVFSNDNQSLYNKDQNLLITYLSKNSADSAMPSSCYGSALGVGFLSNNNQDIPFANRILSRYSTNDYYPLFGAPLIDTHEEAVWALRGLDHLGNPMLNPETGLETRFAFTGDPNSHTGWLDERTDVYQMVSQPRFNLEPGAKRSFTVVWILASRENSESAINSMLETFQEVESLSSIWDPHLTQ